MAAVSLLLRYLLLGRSKNLRDPADHEIMADFDFGEIIRAKRKATGLSQEAVAKKAGLGIMTYGRIERGEVQPKLKQVLAIFSALGLTMESVTEKKEEKLTAADCMNRIEHYLNELRTLLGP